MRGWVVIVILIILILFACMLYVWETETRSNNNCLENIYYPCDPHKWCETHMNKTECQEFCEINMKEGDMDDYCFAHFCEEIGNGGPPVGNDVCLEAYCEPICRGDPVRCGNVNECSTWYCDQNPVPSGCGWDSNEITACESLEQNGCYVQDYINKTFVIRCVGLEKHYLRYEQLVNRPFNGAIYLGGGGTDLVPIIADYSITAPTNDEKFLWIVRDTGGAMAHRFVLQPYTYYMRRFSLSRLSPNTLSRDFYLGGSVQASENVVSINIIGVNYATIGLDNKLLTVTNDTEIFANPDMGYNLYQAFQFIESPDFTLDFSDGGVAYDIDDFFTNHNPVSVQGKLIVSNSSNPEECSNTGSLSVQNGAIIHKSDTIGNIKWYFNDGFSNLSNVPGWYLYTGYLKNTSGEYITSNVSGTLITTFNPTLVVVEFSTWKKEIRLLEYKGSPTLNESLYFNNANINTSCSSNQFIQTLISNFYSSWYRIST